MNIERLKTQQAALQAHTSSKENLGLLMQAYREGMPELRAAIVQKFASFGLQAEIHYESTVVVPLSGRSVEYRVWGQFTFDKERLRSVFSPVVGSLRVLPQMPMALPIEIYISYGSSGDSYSIWWHGLRDNERLVEIVVDVFMGKRGPDELGLRSCFVATVVFGEHSEEVAILRKWRDERLCKSIVGRAFVKSYYGLGPFCAAVVQGNAVIRRLVRAVLLGVCQRLSRRN